jgi:hypothetical protein
MGDCLITAKLVKEKQMRKSEIRTPEQMIDYLIDCTLVTVEGMVYRKSCPKYGEFERQCSIAQTGINFLGAKYPFISRAKKFALKETAFEYYTRQHKLYLEELK